MHGNNLCRKENVDGNLDIKTVIMAIIVALVAFLIWFCLSGYFHSLVLYIIYWPLSKGLPPCPSTYVGRANEEQEILQLSMMEKANKIINIIGPPGFGKSTLAICVGNTLISWGRVVRYIDMSEVTHQHVQQIMAEKILYQESTHSEMTNVTFDHLLSWSARRFSNNLVIFDNCDEVLNYQKDQFNEAVEMFVKQSNYIKVLITSREESLYLEQSQAVKVDSLSVNESCNLLEIKSPGVISMEDKMTITKLTGSVPLALQIVGSLLNRKSNPPSSSAIIEDLQHHPIPTLSPVDLHKKMRVNACISVSYNYLDTKLRKVARYLANFPGSFSKLTAIAVLKSISSNTIKLKVTEDYISSCLDSLLTRSLLEYNPHTKRYHFHHLLKEFFRAVQWDKYRVEKGEFILSFQIQVSYKLTDLTILFRESPKKALSALDDEKPNVQYLLNITGRPYKNNHGAYLVAVDAINFAMRSNFLPRRFSAEELIEVTDSIVNVMEAKVNNQRLSEVNILRHYIWYVDFIWHHATILYKLKQPRNATKWMLTHVKTVEYVSERIVDPKLQQEVGTTYNIFYLNLLMFEHFLDEKHVRMCNTRLLLSTIQLHHNTSPEDSDFSKICGKTENTCPYKMIGITYYHIQEYKRSINFLEKAFRVSEILGLNEHVRLSIYLVKSYQKTGEVEKALDAFKRTVIPVYTNVLESPLTDTILEYEEYVRLLDHYGETEKAHELERKELNEILEMGAKGETTLGLRAYVFANQMYNKNNNTEAITMATLALRSMETESVEQTGAIHITLPLKVLLGKAHYRNGSTEHSVEFFKEVADWIVQNNATNIHILEYYASCSYLLNMMQMRYIYECFLYNYGYAMWAEVIELGYFIITPPLDLYDKEEEKKSSKSYDKHTSESRTKDILLPAQGNDYALSSRNYYSSFEPELVKSYVHDLLGVIEGFLNTVSKFILRYTIVRALVIILAVLFKLAAIGTVIYVGFYFCICGCCCCCALIFASILMLDYLIRTTFGYIETNFFGHVY